MYSQAYTESVLYTPPSLDGFITYSPVIQASDGNFYGIAGYTQDTAGNRTGGPTLYRVSPQGQSATVYSFPTDVSTITTGVIQGGDGAFYGVVEGGNGSIIKVDLSGTYSVLHTFCSDPSCPDGTSPASALAQGSDGNFYGTTLGGGTNQSGTIFKITPSGTLTTLYTFCSGGGAPSNCPDGSSPWGLVQGTDGNFYGTTFSGGADCPSIPPGHSGGCGTIFKMSSSGVLTTLHTFAGGSDGAYPTSTLVEASGGSLYGIERDRPNFIADGVTTPLPAVFKMTANGTVSGISTLQEYQPPNEDGLIVGSDGDIYGTVFDGNSSGGNVYQIDPTGITTTIYNFPFQFPYSSGANPTSPLVQGSDGSFVGTTNYGGTEISVPYGSGFQSTGTVFELSVAPALSPPVSLSLSQQTIQSGQSVTLSWSVANAYSLTLQQCYAFVQGSPSGAGNWTGLQTGTFNASGAPPFTGSATVTPTANGVYVYALTCGGKESGFATLVVGTPPTLSITTASLPAGQVGNVYSQTFMATGGVPPYTWSISSGSLPTGITLSPLTGVISGTPVAPGTSAFTVQIKDSETSPQIANANLSILANPAPLAITTTALPGATVGTAYSQPLQASGGITPYSWSISSGSLPPGLSLSSTGVISGIPTSSATFVFTVKVTDAESTPQSATAGLNIVVANTSLFVGTQTLAGGSIGTPYSASLQAYGGVAPYTWSLSSGSLPAGLTLASTTGVISGTPTTAGTGSFTVQAKDSEGTPEVATASLSITVAAPALSVSTASLPGGTVGTAYSQTLKATGGVNPYSWSVTSGSLPVGLTLASTTGVISGTPTTAGTTSFTVQAQDAEGTPQTATANLSIRIASAVTTTSLVSSVTTAGSGNPVTLTATIAKTSGSGIPSGTVTFFDGTTNLGTMSLNGSGVATFTTSALAVGTHSLTAEYGGDAADSGSVSSAVVVTITQSLAQTNTSLVTTSSSVTVGTSVTFTASVKESSGSAVPTGSVTFFDGTTLLGSGVLSSGKASFSTSILTVGTHSITATYAGDATDASSTSSATTITVTLLPTSVKLQASPVSVSFGASVTLSATVSGPSGMGTPSGVVTFSNGSTPLGTATLNGSGVGTYTTSTLPVGSNSISASYAATGNFGGAASSSVTVTVNPDTTTTTLQASPTTLASGGSVTFTATVAGPAGIAIPAGTVTFATGTTTLGSAPLNGSGIATLTTTALPTGSDSVTASFAGSGNFAGSVSNGVVVTVSPPPTPDFSIAVSPASLTITPGQSGTAVFTVTPTNGFAAPVTFACSGLPSEAACSFSPSSVTPNGSAATSTLTITTTAARSSIDLPHDGKDRTVYAGVLPGLLLLVGIAARRRGTRAVRLMGVLVFVSCLTAFVGCGGGTNTSTSPGDPGTPAGTKTITVSASSAGTGATSHSANLTVTIQ